MGVGQSRENRLNWDPITHYQDTEVARRYDRERFNSLAGRVFNALEQHFIRRAFRYVQPGARVIDVPCGTGRLAEALLEAGFSVTGVDISPAMLNVAHERLERFGKGFRSQVADVRSMQASAGGYDAVLCARVLMHFPLEGQIEFLSAAARLSRGPIVLTQSLDSPYQRFRRRVKRLLGNQPPAGYPVSNEELKTLLKKSGLGEVARFRPMALISEEIIVVAEHL